MKNPTKEPITIKEFVDSSVGQKTIDSLRKKKEKLGDGQARDNGWMYCLLNEAIDCLERMDRDDYCPSFEVDKGILREPVKNVADSIMSALHGETAGNLLGTDDDAYWLAFEYLFDFYREDENFNRLF